MPEFQPVASDVDVWATESPLIHVTVVPTATFNSSGIKAAFPSAAAPTGIVTEDDGPAGVGAGAGEGAGVGDGPATGDEEFPPQAIADIKSADTRARRKDNIRSSKHEVS